MRLAMKISASVLLALGIILLAYSLNLQPQIKYFTERLSRIGELYPDFVQNRLTLMVHAANLSGAIGVFFILLGTLVIFLSFKNPPGTVVVLLIMLMFMSIVNMAHADNSTYTYRPHVSMRNYYWQPNTIVNTYANITVVPAQYYSSGFIAHLLAIGNPTTGEFVEAGYFQDGSGFHLYTSSSAQGAVTIIGDAVLYSKINLEVNDFVVGSPAVFINGNLVNDLTFTDTSNLEYLVQSETTDPLNSFNVNFTEMKATVHYYDIDYGWVCATINWPSGNVINWSPYTVVLIYGSDGGITGANIYGGTPPNGGGGPGEAQSGTGGGGGIYSVK